MCSFYSTIIPVLFVVVNAVLDTLCVKVGFVCFCICNVCLYLLAWWLFHGPFWAVVNLGIVVTGVESGWDFSHGEGIIFHTQIL